MYIEYVNSSVKIACLNFRYIYDTLEILSIGFVKDKFLYLLLFYFYYNFDVFGKLIAYSIAL